MPPIELVPPRSPTYGLDSGIVLAGAYIRPDHQREFVDELDRRLVILGRTEIDHDLRALENDVWKKIDAQTLPPMSNRMATALCAGLAVLALLGGAVTATAAAAQAPSPIGLSPFMRRGRLPQSLATKMPKVWRTALFTALVACAAAAFGVYASLTFFAYGRGRGHAPLDAVMHRQLHLSTTQNHRIAEIETRYASRKSSLEAEMRTAAREIAAAVSDDKAYTPRVQQAIDHFHTATGELQQETILHVFEMRAVLSPSQQTLFDEIVRTELLHSADDAESD